MLDANAKIPSGIFNGNTWQYGEFDQCLSVKPKGDAFKSLYCLVSLQLTLPESEKYLNYLRRLALGNEPYRSEFDDVSSIRPTCFQLVLSSIFSSGRSVCSEVIRKLLGRLFTGLVFSCRHFVSDELIPDVNDGGFETSLEGFCEGRRVSSG